MSDAIADFMAADVLWFSPPEFYMAFNYLTGDTPMPDQAAFTKPEPLYPAYINAGRVGPEHIQLTVRGDASEDGAVGPLARIVIHMDDWYQFVADAARLQPVPNEAPSAESAAVARQRHAGEPTEAEGHSMTPAPIPSAFHETETEVVDLSDDVSYITEEIRDAVENGTANGASAGDPLGLGADTRSEAELDRDADSAYNGKVMDAGGFGTDPDNGRAA